MLRPRRTGSIATVVVIVLVLAAAGAAGWWFFLRSTPERTVRQLIAAQQEDNSEAFEALLTEETRGHAGVLRGITSSMTGDDREPEYTVGETSIEGDSATVPVTFPAPEQLARVGLTEMTVTYALSKEEGAWRVNVDETFKATIRGLSGLGGAVPGGPPE